MSKLVLGPFNRVEGDLEVSLEVSDGAVHSARVNAPLYRGFEPMLLGKAPLDALAIVPRICGICSVAQSAAAASALAEAMGLTPPPNGRLARNLIQAGENLADHLTHFYLFFMPDFARAAYAAKPWFAETEGRFKAQTGRATAEMLPARAGFMRLQGYLAGKWPHTMALQPGGTTRAVLAAEKIRLYAARGLEWTACRREEDEIISTRVFGRREVRRLLASGAIVDGKTIAALVRAGIA